MPLINFDYHTEFRGNVKNLDRLKHLIHKHDNDYDFFYSKGADVNKYVFMIVVKFSVEFQGHTKQCYE